MTSGSVSCGRYITGVTYSRPLLRPRWCNRTSGAPSKTPPTLPSFARNSVTVFAFKSSGSLMSNPSVPEPGHHVQFGDDVGRQGQSRAGDVLARGPFLAAAVPE